MALAPWSERLLQRWAVSLPGRASVLDVGCGHGFEVERMRRDFGLNPIGIDLSLGMLRLARTRTDGRVAQADATRLPLRTESVQGVWSMHTLLHVLDLGAALAEMRRVLQPDGVAAFTIALGNGLTVEPVAFQPEATRQFVHWSSEDADDAVVRAGLQVLEQGVDTDGRDTKWVLAKRP